MGAGADLAERYYRDVVRPIVVDVLGDPAANSTPQPRSGPSSSFSATTSRAQNEVGHLAGRLGSGSDVLGYDDERSRDHDFGLRLTVLVDDDAADAVATIDTALAEQLPESYNGRPTRFVASWDPREWHRVDVHTVHDFADSRLGFDCRSPLTASQWLCLTGQSVLEVTGGPVFHDSTNAFQPLATSLQWYPEDVWYYVLAAAWTRLSQEFPFLGRTGERADHVGSYTITGRLARDVVHLAFLLERRWPPYPKWTGAALAELPTGPALVADLARVARAVSWQGRQAGLAAAVDTLAARQRAIGLPHPDPPTHAFFDRPFLISNERVQEDLHALVEDPALRRLPKLGSIEQWCDNVDLLSTPRRRAAVERLYLDWMDDG